ncbi:unnamed protein product [Allacma fusca]|uniref:Pescadillo homolog n=1 Tax=Allacma fusca TaxID=39272 RepID=A0A8J2Q1T8_9HEXA|nr:unnamed protein product [Allacma fusca]
MGKIKKKYESGEATKYITRKQALLKLQLSLKLFRKLCILKGIYPREPKNRKKAQKGATDKKTLYLKKDIQFLLHEPIVESMRDHKIFLRKKKRAKVLRDQEALKRALESKPTYRLDHIVKERYPTFIDAIRDLDDCLTMCFLFATFPGLRFVPVGVVKLCRRLTVEFMHYVIEAKALRKVFISIKGYYYQAEVKGQTITWIVPHSFGFQPQSPDDVDFRIMATFIEFYTTLLGFINFRLFNSINVFYPPKVLLLPSQEEDSKDGDKELVSADEHLIERVAALNQHLLREGNAEDADQEPEIDEFPNVDDQDKIEEMKREAARVAQLKTLFSGLKFFLNREIPREPLTFVIRSGGGQVSWDREVFPGATFDVSDESITHQIVDRDNMDTQYLSRTYIQPQWIFDSFNARQLLPMENYFPGAILPPHVSPFHVEREGDYVPPEKRKLFDLERGILTGAELVAAEKKDDSEEEEYEEDGEAEDITELADDDSVASDDDNSELLDGDSKAKRKSLKKQMKVQPGKAEEIDMVKMKEGETKEQYRLRVMMIKNKHKRVYNRMMKSRQRRKKEADRLVTKRQSFQDNSNPSPKTSKKGKTGKASA